MSEYGRGQGSQPWHPEDPLYGDPGLTGQQPAYSHAPHGRHPQQPPQPQQPQWEGQYGHQQQYGWDPSQPAGPAYGAGPGDPYGHQPAGPYAGEHPGYYNGQDGYPPRQPPHQQYQEPYRQPQRQQQADAWAPEPDEPEHPFFADSPDQAREREWREDDDDDEPARAGRRGGRERRPKKRRSGTACLIVAVVLLGGVGGAGWFGYQFWQEHFGPAPDYAGEGSGAVQVEIPQDASGVDMGNILKKAGVVKSVEAFTEAAAQNPRGGAIQPGFYTLRKHMSAAAAVKAMVDPSALNALIVPEGKRATEIYQAIDTKLKLADGTTAKVAKKADLGLPAWAKGNPEGFLFPSRYSVGDGTKPEDILREMVRRAEAEFAKDDLVAQARRTGKSPYEVLVIASLVQAEAQEKHEFGKVSRVIYNRLDQSMALGFDSTINYAKGRSTLDTTIADTKFNSPYNTYLHKGLPPGPIDNPGHQAIDAALNPTPGNWLYFVTVKPGDTRFTASDTEHQKNVEDFNRYQREHKNG